MVRYFKYGKEEMEYLKKKDPILGKEIDRIGMIQEETNSNEFAFLISSIIGQQVSTKSAITVRNRLIDLIGPLTPENINQVEIDAIQKCGMSMRKASYIKEIAKKASSKEINFEKLHQLSDEEIMKELMTLKGVGEWTAEMVLLFAFERPDIVSFKDLGIRRGMMELYELEELTREQFLEFKAKYSPYGSVASLYLWEIFEGE